MQQIDLSVITDVKELKALAYDLMQAIETQRLNLQAVNDRIAQVVQAAATAMQTTSSPAAEADAPAGGSDGAVGGAAATE